MPDQIQVLNGCNWVAQTEDQIPANILMEIEGEVFDGGIEQTAGITLSNGLTYRWC